jgi:hypothetical protein
MATGSHNAEGLNAHLDMDLSHWVAKHSSSNGEVQRVSQPCDKGEQAKRAPLKALSRMRDSRFRGGFTVTDG